MAKKLGDWLVVKVDKNSVDGARGTFSLDSVALRSLSVIKYNPQLSEISYFPLA